MIDNDQIRRALTAIADRAHEPGAVATAILERARPTQYSARRPTSRRTVLAIAGAATATAAVAGIGGTVLIARGTAPTSAGGTAPGTGPATRSSPAAPPNRAVAMRYRPTWLPEGFVETGRRVTVSGPDQITQDRNWERGRAPGAKDPRTAANLPYAAIYLQLARSQGSWPTSGWRSGTIAGRRAWLATGPNHRPQVIWEPEPGTQLSVTIMYIGGNVTEMARRIAESVVAETTATCEVPVRFGWLPPGQGTATDLTLCRQGAGWSVNLRSLDPARPEDAIVDVLIGPPRPPIQLPGTVPATLRGRPGLVSAGRQETTTSTGAAAQVDLAPDRQLLLLALNPMRREDVIHIVDDLRIGPDPEVSWIGR